MQTHIESDRDLTSTRQLVANLFIQGFPLVLMDLVRRAHPVEANQVLRLADDSAALAPSLPDEGAESVRISAWVDLSGGPVVLDLPNMHGRYFNLTLIDAAGKPFASLGSRTGEDHGGELLLAGPRWDGAPPEGLTMLRAPGDAVWAVGRASAQAAADRPQTEALVARQRLVPLDQRGDPSGPARIRRLDPPVPACVQQAMDMTPNMFGHRLNLLIERWPGNLRPLAGADDRMQLGMLNDLRRAADGDPALARALAHGFADAAAAIRLGATFEGQAGASGWRAANARARPHASDLDAAILAYADLGGPGPEDMMSWVCSQDETGRPLSGSERYRIHFPRGAAPPVEAFWTLQACPRAPRGGRGDLQQAIDSRRDLTFNPDGSLDLILQHDAPGGGQATTWLPSPREAFALNMRLHWPKPAALHGVWAPPALERLGSGYARRSERAAARPWAAGRRSGVATRGSSARRSGRP